MLRNEEPARFTACGQPRPGAGRGGDPAAPQQRHRGRCRGARTAGRRSSRASSGWGSRAPFSTIPTARRSGAAAAQPSLAWFFALASGLPALLARLPLYRRAKPLDAAEPARRRLGDRRGDGVPAPGLEGGGPARRGVPLLRPGPRLLRARPPGRLVGRRYGRSFRVLHHHGATIGRAAGASRRQHPELLWSDLLRWARKHHGAAWAARAETALRTGARLRLAARRLAGPFAAGRERAAWRRTTARRAAGAGGDPPACPCHPPP